MKESSPGRGRVPRLRRSLDRLERRGGLCLLTGRAENEVVRLAARRLLGSSARLRYRVVVRTPEWADASLVGDRLPDDRAIAVTHDGPVDVPKTDLDPPQTPLGETTLAALATITRSADPQPGELRVVVLSLADLLEEDPAEARTFCRTLAGWMRAYSGIAHVHIPREELPAGFGDVCDAHVELRGAAASPEHRWHLRRSDVRTDWLSLDP